MDVKIKYEKLFSTFENMMEGYSNLDYTEKSYDSWVFEKNRYIDLNVINFYHDIEEDYEDDDWVMQYQNEPGDEGREEDLPILRYGDGYSFKSEQSMFGHYFDELLKDWFEKVYGHKVKTVVSI
jgi:hypothetical protein